ncbi:MAG: transcriptional regulator [Caproiciproducens sp.]|jgi:putative transcriptional regulator|nr:transcriptional regulator [Caproiciproducens sp.]
MDKENEGVMRLSKNLRLKSARAALDMSQKDVAEAVGVTRQTMNAIENGDYNPSVNLCIAICRVLGKTLDQLFWEDESNEKN